VNVYTYLLRFGGNRAVVIRLFSEFGERLTVALALQVLSMSRLSAEPVVAVCAWLAGLVERYERLAAAAAKIVDPLDVSVCAEFLSPRTDRNVLRAVLRLIAALAGNQTCAAIFAARKEVPSLFAKTALLADAGVAAGLMNVVERFTFHNPRYAPEKMVKALPIVLRADELEVQRSALRVVCQIVMPEHGFLLDDGIPERVAGFVESTDPTVCWLAIRTMTQLVTTFGIEGVFFVELRGKERLFEVVRRKELCRAVLIALAALLQLCQRLSDDEKAEVVMEIQKFEGFDGVKHLASLVDAWS
jgi:hypothetical protein